MANLYGSGHVAVKVASTTGTFNASLRDLSEGGLGLDIKNPLDEFQNLKSWNGVRSKTNYRQCSGALRSLRGTWIYCRVAVSQS